MGGSCCLPSVPAAKAELLKVVGMVKPSNDEKADFRDIYKVGRKLGEGAFGIVFECRKISAPKGDNYAVKMLEHQSGTSPSDGGRSSSFAPSLRGGPVPWEDFTQELEMMRRLTHPHVIKLWDVFLDSYFLYFVMDKYECDLVDASQYCREKQLMPMSCVGEITKQMLASVAYLHEQSIVHRDVKADNYLVDGMSFSGRTFKVVLTDLSTAVFIEDGVFLKELEGTEKYWAPEIALRCYAHKVDCWAIGVVLWCLLTNRFPFKSMSEACRSKLDFREKLMTREVFEFILKLLEKKPVNRVSAKAAMEHRWIQDSSKEHSQTVAKVSGQVTAKANEAANNTPSADRNDATGAGFGNLKKPVSPEVAQKRQDMMNKAAKRHSVGETGARPYQEAMAEARQQSSSQESSAQNAGPLKRGGTIVVEGTQRAGEARTYCWWSAKRCDDKKVPGVDADDASGERGKCDESKSEQAGDEVVSKMSSVEELAKFLEAYKVDTTQFGKATAKPVEFLFRELEDDQCHLLRRGDRIVRVVDLLALRIKYQGAGSAQAKYLVETVQQFRDGRRRQVNRVPAVKVRLAGSGAERAIAEVARYLKTVVGTTDQVIILESEIKAYVSHHDQSSYNEVSNNFPGLNTLYRKTTLNAAVNLKAEASELRQIGLPMEAPFAFEYGDINSTFEWRPADRESVSQGLIPSAADAEGFKPLLFTWTEETMTSQLRYHRIDISKFGVGEARSIKAFVQEANTYETRLFSNGQELRRHLDILVIKIKNPMGTYLVETSHSFGKGQTKEKSAFPATKVRPFEDKVWAVRRLLREISVPNSVSKIMFGSSQTERKESPSYPGVVTVYSKQVVDVELMELDVDKLCDADLPQQDDRTLKPH